MWNLSFMVYESKEAHVKYLLTLEGIRCPLPLGFKDNVTDTYSTHSLNFDSMLYMCFSATAYGISTSLNPFIFVLFDFILR